MSNWGSQTQTHICLDVAVRKPVLSYHDTEQTNASFIHSSVGGFCKRAQHWPNCDGAGINGNLTTDSARIGIGYHCPRMSSVIELHILQRLYNYSIFQSSCTTTLLPPFLVWLPCWLPRLSICFPRGTAAHLQMTPFSWLYRVGIGRKHFKFQWGKISTVLNFSLGYVVLNLWLIFQTSFDSITERKNILVEQTLRIITYSPPHMKHF